MRKKFPEPDRCLFGLSRRHDENTHSRYPHKEKFASCVAAVQRVCRHHAWLICVSVIYILCAIATLNAVPAGSALVHPPIEQLWLSTPSLLLLGLCIGLLLDIVLLRHPRRPLLMAWRDIRFILTLEQLIASGLVLLLLCPVIYYFMAIKSVIPFINPHVFDTTFAHADWLIGFGHLPQSYLRSLTTPAWRYQTYSAIYSAGWAGTTLSVVGYTIFRSPESARKSRFLLAYSLNWILLGSACAIALNSGGPLFFHQYTGLTTYDTFVHHLQAMSGQKDWTSYALAQTLGGDPTLGIAATPGLGISAMPSLHVATSLIVVLHAWQCGRLRRLLACCYFIVMAVGSVALGWHYVVDGITATVLGLGIWLLADRLARRQSDFWQRRSTDISA